MEKKMRAIGFVQNTKKTKQGKQKIYLSHWNNQNQENPWSGFISQLEIPRLLITTINLICRPEIWCMWKAA